MKDNNSEKYSPFNVEHRTMDDGNWFWAHHSLLSDPHLNHSDKLVYLALATFDGMEKIMPGYKLIASRVDFSVRQCKKSIKNLVSHGYIKVIKGRGRSHTNLYYLSRMPKGCIICTHGGRVKNEMPIGEQLDVKKGSSRSPYKDKEKDNNKNRKIIHNQKFLEEKKKILMEKFSTG